MGPFAVIYIIIGGWIFIIACFIIIYFIYYIQPLDHRVPECSDDLNEQAKYVGYIEQQSIHNEDLNTSQTTKWYSDIYKWPIWSSANINK